jgi:thioredoxin-dependent peroxiredoxin
MTDITRSIISGLGAARAQQIAVGAPAPGFELKDQDTKTHKLGDYRGRWVVLYFYPKDNSPACTTEACSFRDDLPTLRALGVQILGVSVGHTESHARFAEKHCLPFPLLADHGGAVAKTYGSLWSLGLIKFAKRHTFVIDPEGKIARIYRHVKPKEHSRQVSEDVKALKRGEE